MNEPRGEWHVVTFALLGVHAGLMPMTMLQPKNVPFVLFIVKYFAVRTFILCVENQHKVLGNVFVEEHQA